MNAERRIRRATAACGADDRETIRVGFIGDCKGWFSSYYESAVAGAELPFVRRGAEPLGSKPSDGVSSVSIGGRRVELLVGCDFSGPLRNMLAEARRLVEQEGAAVLVAPNYLVGDFVSREYGRRQPSVAFVVTDLGVLGWATTAGFVAEFCSLGGTVLRRYRAPRDIVDWSPLVRQIPAGVDGVALMAGLQGTKSFFSAYRKVQPDLPRHVVMSAYPIAVGQRPVGIVAAGFLPFVWSAPNWTRYFRDLRATFPVAMNAPGLAPNIHSYGAVEATLEALEQVDGDLSGGGQRFRDALTKLHLRTPAGTYRLRLPPPGASRTGGRRGRPDPLGSRNPAASSPRAVHRGRGPCEAARPEPGAPWLPTWAGRPARGRRAGGRSGRPRSHAATRS
jgi:branched-chain amino acid transport system substrate-binding protein